MDSKRVDQIINTTDNISVYYKNTPVYLKEVDHKTNKVKVENLNTHKDFVVHVKTLNENYGMN